MEMEVTDDGVDATLAEIGEASVEPVDDPDTLRELIAIKIEVEDVSETGVAETYDSESTLVEEPVKRKVRIVYPKKRRRKTRRKKAVRKVSLKGVWAEYVVGKDGRWSCSCCESSYTIFDSLRKHIMRKHNKLCNAAPETSDLELKNVKYSDHVSIANDGFSCDFCKKRYGHLKSMRRHLESRHSGALGTATDLPTTSPAVARSLKESVAESKYSDYIKLVDDATLSCIFCHRDYPCMNTMRRHLCEKHGERIIEIESGSEKKSYRPKTNCKSLKEQVAASKYREHIEVVEDALVCKLCRREYPEINAMRRHVMLHLESTDPASYKCTRRTIRERDEVYKLVSKAGDSHQCLECGLIYGRVETLRRHILRIHLQKSLDGVTLTPAKKDEFAEVTASDYFKHENNKFQCLICGAVLKMEDTLMVHLRCHLRAGMASQEEFDEKSIQTSPGTNSCNICLNLFQSESLLKYHIKWHILNGVIRVRCEHCSGAILATNVDKHMRDKHKDVLPDRTCQVCLATVPYVEYRAHKKEHRVKEERYPKIPGQTFLCEYCGANYKSRGSLWHHRRMQHAGPDKYTKCDVCQRDIRINLMKKHKESHENEAEIFFCDRCGKEFPTKGSFQRHMVIVHLRGSKQFECHICGKSLSKRDSLESHLNIHRGLRPFVCDVCGMGFHARSNMKQHQKVHSALKPHQCPYCEKAFRNRGPWKRHVCLHTGERNYHCDQCDRGFIHKHHFDKHNCGGRPRPRKMKSPRRVVNEEEVVPGRPPPIGFQPTEYVPSNCYPQQSLDVNRPLQVNAIDLSGHHGDPYGATYDYQSYQHVFHTPSPYQPLAHCSGYTPLTNRIDPQKLQDSRSTTPKTGQDVFQEFLKNTQQLQSLPRAPIAQPAATAPTRQPSIEPVPSSSSNTDDWSSFKFKAAEPKVEKLIIKLPNSLKKTKTEPVSPEAAVEPESRGSSDNEDFDMGGAYNDDEDTVSEREFDADPDSSWEETKPSTSEGATLGTSSSTAEEESMRSSEPGTSQSAGGRPGGRKKRAPSELLECPECEKICKGQRSLTVHLRKHFPLENSNKDCSVCGKRFLNKTRLDEHMRIHTGAKPFVCELCGRAFRTGSSRAVHMRTHTGEKPYECEYCSKRFGFRSGWKRHLESHVSPGITTPTKSNSRDYICDICGKTLARSESLKVHVKTHSGIKEFSCHLCAHKSVTKAQIKKHIASHSDERPYICSVCGSAFKYMNNLKRHELTHSTERPFCCDACGMTFTGNDGLYRHSKQVHNRTYKQCRYCDKAYCDSTTLKRHENKHIGKYDFSCTFCPKGFDKRYELRRHLQVHQFGRGKRAKGNGDFPLPGYQRRPLNLTSRYEEEKEAIHAINSPLQK